MALVPPLQIGSPARPIGLPPLIMVVEVISFGLMTSFSTSADIMEISGMACASACRPLIVRVLGALRSAIISVGIGFDRDT